MTLQDGKSKKLYIVGNYRFTGKLLGKGNFARVEEAVHNILNVKVAVKIMDINQIKEEYVVRNLCREAKLMAKLNHPCVCALYQTMQRSDNVYYLVTELASGGDLCTFVKEQRGGRLEERPARIYARQFVSALGHMHTIGVVHRDLKMENVMLNSARTQIKIVDFGLSNFYSPNEPLKTHCGSPEYAAPELFVTGLKYGPEVDLWSLGIILYGMVIGELPFVSNRSDQLTSQERRKKLVAQINKGLGSAHKRALANFSSDFRNMIGRMLVSDIAKRISIKDLMTHPFITEKQTKMIRINPIKKLDVRHQAGIIAEICELTLQPSDEVIRAIKQEPYSKAGGMFNILAHRFALRRLSGDGVTKVQPALEGESKAKNPQDSPVKRPFVLRDHRVKPFDARGNSYSPSGLVQYRKLAMASQQEKRPAATVQEPFRPWTEQGRPCSPSTGIRPQTVLPKISENKPVNYRDVKTSFMARKAYSAGITPKTSRPATVASPNVTNVIKVPSPLNTKTAKDVSKKLYSLGQTGDNENRRKMSKEGTDAAVGKKATSPNELKSNLKPEKSGAGRVVTNRAQTALDSKQRSKSEKIPRPSTTSPVVMQKSVPTTQCNSKVVRAQTASTKPFARLLKLSRPATVGHSTNKPDIAYGDIAQKNQALYQKLKKPIIYDPIARSIAGYVCNNVPKKLTNLSHFKK